jgi:transporter family protein
MLSLFVVKPQAIKSADVKTIAILILSGFLASFVAQITFYHGLKIGEVSKVVPISGSYYLVAFVLGLILFKEAVTVQKIVGMVLVAVGVWFLR